MHDGDCSINNILLHYYKDNLLQNKHLHISEFDKNFKCELEFEKTNNKGVVVKNYKVLENVYINSIDQTTGDNKLNKITHWSIHENLNMYRFKKRKYNRIKQISKLHVSDDHSIIVYDKLNSDIKKIKPETIIENKSNYFLIKSKQKHSNLNNSFRDYFNYTNIESIVNEHNAGYLFGVYLGDGYLSYTGHKETFDKTGNVSLLALTNSDDNISKRWCDILEYFTENKIVRKKDAKSKYPNKFDFKKKDGSNYKIAKRSYVSDVNLATEVNKHFSKGSENKHLPNWICNVNNDFIKGLLGGYFDTDGTVNVKKRYISFTSKSETLLNNLRFVLKYKLNIESSISPDVRKSYIGEGGKEIKTDDKSKWRTYWILTIYINLTNKDFFNEFIENIESDDKIDKLKNILDNLGKSISLPVITYIPNTINIKDLDNLSVTDKKNIKSNSYCGSKIIIPDDVLDNSNLNNVTKNLLRKQNSNEIEFIPCDCLDIYLDPDETIGYDLTVEDYSTFATDDGIFLWDTIAIYAILSTEANEEVKKMNPRHSKSAFADPSSYKSQNIKFTLDFVSTIFSATKNYD